MRGVWHDLQTAGPYLVVEIQNNNPSTSAEQQLLLMDAAIWASVIAQALMIENWFVGFSGLAVYVPVYLTRVPAEERIMLDRFGDEYRAYMERTGGIVPRF